MNTKTFVIADTHFGHDNICKFTREDGTKLRPWNDVNEMNQALIDNWNSVVREQDMVFVLGDFTVNKKWVGVARQLAGRKILVAGNHDNATPQMYMDAGFGDVRGCHVLYKKEVLLTHIPVHESQLARFSGGNIHGHLHDHSQLGVRTVLRDRYDGHKFLDEEEYVHPLYLCVSVEQPYVNYTPLLLEEALHLLKEKKNGKGIVGPHATVRDGLRN